jgi:hypothetical protein
MVFAIRSIQDSTGQYGWHDICYKTAQYSIKPILEHGKIPWQKRPQGQNGHGQSGRILSLNKRHTGHKPRQQHHLQHDKKIKFGLAWRLWYAWWRRQSSRPTIIKERAMKDFMASIRARLLRQERETIDNRFRLAIVLIGKQLKNGGVYEN